MKGIVKLFWYVRPKTPAPMIRIESKGAGPWVMEGEEVAMLRINGVANEGREGREWKRFLSS